MRRHVEGTRPGRDRFPRPGRFPQPGGPGQAARVYLRPDAPWASYESVLLDPVTAWRSPDSPNTGISAKDGQTLADYFYGVIRDSLEKRDFPLKSSPGPRKLRVEVAITQAHASDVALDIISTVVPSAHAPSEGGHLATGKPAIVGEAQVETKVTDAVTGDLLAAAIDHRGGGKTIGAAQFSSWGEVEAMMRLWAGPDASRRRSPGDRLRPGQWRVRALTPRNMMR